MNLEVRILNELRGCFLDLRILQELANRGSGATRGRRRKTVGDLMRQTRESIAREYQLAKYYAGYGKNSGANGRGDALSGVGTCAERFVVSRNLPQLPGKTKSGDPKAQVRTCNLGYSAMKSRRLWSGPAVTQFMLMATLNLDSRYAEKHSRSELS